MCDQTQLPFVAQNRDRHGPMPPLPLPPAKGMPHEVNTYEDVPDEPRFDPSVHLALEDPEYIVTLGDYKAKKAMSEQEAKEDKFAWSSSFRVRREQKSRIEHVINNDVFRS